MFKFNALSNSLKVLIFGSLLAVSCNVTVPPVLITPSPTPLPGPVFVQIDDEWEGYKYTSPEKTRIVLERVGTHFSGTVRYSFGGHFLGTVSATEQVTIPSDVVDSFAETLANVPLDTSKFIARPTQPDNYFSITIEIKNEKEKIVYISSSSGYGEDNPWQVIISDGMKATLFVMRSDVPRKQIDSLTPYLRPDVRELLIKQLDKMRAPTPTSTSK